MVKRHYPVKNRQVDQRQPVPGRRDMVQNRAGGYVFEADPLVQMRRFLILGTDSNTYYAGSEELTDQNVDMLEHVLKHSPVEYLDMCSDVYENANAPKQDPVIFALAFAIAHGNEDVRRDVAHIVSTKFRIATHLFAFVHYAKFFRGWGRALRRAVAEWYESRTPAQLSYQIAKYGNRYGYTHRDLIRLSHPGLIGISGDIARWALGTDNFAYPDSRAVDVLYDYDAMRNPEADIVRIVQNGNVTHDMVPTTVKKDPELWRTLLDRDMLPMTALIRNLGAMTSYDVFTKKYADTVVNLLTDKDRVRKSHIHPLSVLAAYNTYDQGTGFRGSLSWEPDRRILDALNKTFNLSFGNVETIGNRILMACDISGSMGCGYVAGLPGINPITAEAALCKIYADTEDKIDFVAFERDLTPFSVRRNTDLYDITTMLRRFRMGDTDCAAPILHAMEKGKLYDTIIVVTDNETWAGNIHPYKALQEYRRRTGLNTKFAVIAMTADRFTIADPRDPGMLDFVGFDTAAPNLLAQFAKGMV